MLLKMAQRTAEVFGWVKAQSTSARIARVVDGSERSCTHDCWSLDERGVTLPGKCARSTHSSIDPAIALVYTPLLLHKRSWFTLGLRCFSLPIINWCDPWPHALEYLSGVSLAAVPLLFTLFRRGWWCELGPADNPDLQYDIGYFKRDTRRAPRQMHSYVAPSLRMLADERVKVGAYRMHIVCIRVFVGGG